jgi:hypothetical protein
VLAGPVVTLSASFYRFWLNIYPAGRRWDNGITWTGSLTKIRSLFYIASCLGVYSVQMILFSLSLMQRFFVVPFPVFLLLNAV